MTELQYVYAGRGCRWQARVQLWADDLVAACPVELTLWDAEIQALPGFDPARGHLVAARTIPRADGDALLATLRGLAVPLVPEAELLGGYGGETHELRVRRGDCATSLRWWLDVPAGWSEAAAVAATLRAWIAGWRDDLLAGGSAAGAAGLRGPEAAARQDGPEPAARQDGPDAG